VRPKRLSDQTEALIGPAFVRLQSYQEIVETTRRAYRTRRPPVATDDEAGRTEGWCSLALVSRSIFVLVDDRDRAYFGRGEQDGDQFGYIDAPRRTVFGRSYAAEPDVLVEQLKEDEAIAEADTLLLTVPNQLGVAYNAHVLEAILTTVAPAFELALKDCDQSG
jgi:hypothetical protein